MPLRADIMGPQLLYALDHAYFALIAVHGAENKPPLWILATANTVFRRRGPFCPRLRMRRMNTHVTHSTNSFWLPQTYIDVCKIPDFTKKAKISWMCFIILNYLYMAHHNLLGIRRQLKIRHLYGTFISTQCICTGSSFVYRFSSFSWKGAPSTKENCICSSVNSGPYVCLNPLTKVYVYEIYQAGFYGERVLYQNQTVSNVLKPKYSLGK